MGAITDSDPEKHAGAVKTESDFIKLEDKNAVEHFDLQQDIEIVDLEVTVNNPLIILKPWHTFEDTLAIDLGIIKIHTEQQ